MNGRLASCSERLRCLGCSDSMVFADAGPRCRTCDFSVPATKNQIKFVDVPATTQDAQFQQEQMGNSTVLGKIYNFGRRFISSEFSAVNHVANFMKEVNPRDVVIELGSGNRRLGPNVINIDLFPFANVDIVADISDIPLSNSSVDCVVLDTVLEHVPSPGKVIAEIQRILKPGGKVICIVPFIFPYHGYPAHFRNFSKDGLEQMFSPFSQCNVAVDMGPTSALINLVTECGAVALSRGGTNKLLYTLWKGFFLLPIFYFKFLDKLWWRSPHAHRLASTLCAVAVK